MKVLKICDRDVIEGFVLDVNEDFFNDSVSDWCKWIDYDVYVDYDKVNGKLFYCGKYLEILNDEREISDCLEFDNVDVVMCNNGIDELIYNDDDSEGWFGLNIKDYKEYGDYDS
jgi:hypothetical protein